MMQIRGDHMCKRLQNQVLAMFVQRYTGDHTPNWAREEWKDGKPYPLQFKNDQEWLENTFFWCTVKGELSKKHRYCESHPTWPNGIK
jgi:hypothetical protein